MIRWILATVVLITITVSNTFAIEPWNQNRWYWSDHGKPVLLLGGSDDDNLFQWPREKLIPQLDRIVAAGGNVIRNTMSDRKDGGFEVYPFLQLENGKYDHVLYCMDNETKADPQWGEYWARLVRRRSKAAGKRVMITEMWDDWDLTAQRHRQTFDHPELYDFVDVSQNNQNSGQKHWNNFLYVRKYLSSLPRPMNTTKTYGADGNKFKHTDQDAIERFWRHLLAGAASIRFHRPDSGLGINDKAIACLQAARGVEQLIPLWKVEPANELLKDREDNEAFVAASASRDALVLFFPASKRDRRVTLDVGNSAQRGIDWFNIDTGKAVGHSDLKGSVIAPPESGNIVAVIRSSKERE